MSGGKEEYKGQFCIQRATRTETGKVHKKRIHYNLSNRPTERNKDKKTKKPQHVQLLVELTVSTFKTNTFFATEKSLLFYFCYH